MITLIWLLGIVVAYELYVLASFIWRPKMPIAVFGLIQGFIRVENGKGVDAYGGTPGFNFLLMARPAQDEDGGGIFAITHIQYRSRFGFYLAYPACFYFWLITHPQETERDPNDPTNILRKPGTERGFIFRLPGFRWQGSDGRYIITKGQAGFHYD